MFGVGRDEWDADERLYSGDRGDLATPEYDFGGGGYGSAFGADPGDPRQYEPAGEVRPMSPAPWCGPMR